MISWEGAHEVKSEDSKNVLRHMQWDNCLIKRESNGLHVQLIYFIFSVIPMIWDRGTMSLCFGIDFFHGKF